MAELDFTLTAAPILGTDLKLGGNSIKERDDLALVSIAIPQGDDAAVAAALRGGYGLEMPSPTVSEIAGEVRALKTGADQLMLIFSSSAPDARALVQANLNGVGYTTDQTDGWVVLEVDGPEVHAALERICPINLAESVFPEGAFARTVMEHMGGFVIRTGPERFLLLSASSSAGSFLHAVETSFKNCMPGSAA